MHLKLFCCLPVSIDYNENKLGACNSQTLVRPWDLAYRWTWDEAWEEVERLFRKAVMASASSSWFLVSWEERLDLFRNRGGPDLLSLSPTAGWRWVNIRSHWCLRRLLDLATTLRRSSDLNVNCEIPPEFPWQGLCFEPHRLVWKRETREEGVFTQLPWSL